MTTKHLKVKKSCFTHVYCVVYLRVVQACREVARRMSGIETHDEIAKGKIKRIASFAP